MTAFTPRRHEFHPSFVDAGYKSTALRGPKKPAILLPPDAGTTSGPLFGSAFVGPLDADLTRNGRVNGEPLGERIAVTGRLLDEAGRPIRNAVVEVWQANAAGRYIHKRDQHDAPIDPNFRGSGRCVTDDDGRYRFLTVKPGAYPWKNHHNAWRPNHIHLSVFGQGCAARLVTQMYFPGDPLLALDPIFLSTPEIARDRLISAFDLSVTDPEWALGYTFDIVVRGRNATPFEEGHK